MDWYLFLVLVIIFGAVLVTFVCASFSAAPWLPTRGKDIDRILKIADLTKEDRFYDLGCENGRIVFAAANEGALSVGYEISLFPFLLGHIQHLFLKNKDRCKIKYKSFWTEDLSNATVVYFF